MMVRLLKYINIDAYNLNMNGNMVYKFIYLKTMLHASLHHDKKNKKIFDFIDSFEILFASQRQLKHNFDKLKFVILFFNDFPIETPNIYIYIYTYIHTHTNKVNKPGGESTINHDS